MSFANEQEFDAFMLEIDKEMRAERIPIDARDLQGLSRAAKKLQITIFGGPLPDREPRPGIYSGVDLSIRIRRWFMNRYGERLKIDFSPGTAPILIDGDAYAMRLPRIWGRVTIVCNPSTHGKDQGPRLGINRPPVLNLLDCIQGLTPANSAGFSQGDLNLLARHFLSAHESFSWMEHVGTTELGRAARADLAASASAIFANPAHWGLARWAALQATEKFYKSYIESKGHQFARTHNLDHLDETAHRLGFKGIPEKARDIIKCAAAVRYDSSGSTLEQAVEACRASIFACGLLVQASLGQSGRPAQGRA